MDMDLVIHKKRREVWWGCYGKGVTGCQLVKDYKLQAHHGIRSNLLLLTEATN